MTTALAPPTQDELLRHQAETLGFPSLSGYLLWCRKNGLRTAADKTDAELDSERQLAAQTLRPATPHPGRSHTPGRARLIERAYRGEIPPDERYPFSQKLVDLFAAAEGDPARRQALYCLLLQVERRADLLGLKMGLLKWARGESNNYEDALGQLARHHADWLRPVEAWCTDHLNPKAQFRSLTRHLLARYDVPPFMDTAFLQGDYPMAHREQEWFKHVATGNNIRRADLPIKLTKRMAHIFQDANPYWPIARAMRWAQLYGFGGYGKMAWALLTTRLKDYQRDEPFWASVVQFFANHSMLEYTYVGAIVDYIHFQKFVPQQLPGPNGQPIEGPPAQPHFSMKSRSITKLLRLVDEWHGHLNADDYIIADNDSWESAGFREFEREEDDDFSGERVQWSIRELRTQLDLVTEGHAMHHCIASYARRCIEGSQSVWSMQLASPDKLPQRVLTIALDNRKRTVIEYRGKFNMHPHDNKRTAPKYWQDRPYLYYLRESARILRLWMEREGLKHD
jgi:hypothetical protein